MNIIPWYKDMMALEGLEFVLLWFMMFMGALGGGFLMHALLRDSGLSPPLNGVVAFLSVWLGIYARYRWFSQYRLYDVPITIGFALTALVLVFALIAIIRNRF